mmetsp:Transcript_444/g.587  ORF Transcript_444/g.587 Transcript_444/m.587 type:complete len:1090 (-) Transcript_444:515-3784(-)|eukprot:CAMPEP_0203745014 /NCGR_PEP_ID=MMETSP0098-20131031/897_1 /ASSEMBLY_ACC=CAM_ASM_000208 /TAXON_ID=96639 /ORGANISM=" , Strain NY0313808BC1" /LENGTH=1089 /DNA_ID=CAMNT_0050632693 /DNA_START=242 /DNA_END=3511 /DNA_ORIENTATION=+
MSSGDRCLSGEAELRGKVEVLIEDHVVRGICSDTFGLEWVSEADQTSLSDAWAVGVVAGWFGTNTTTPINKVFKGAMKGASSLLAFEHDHSKHRFVVLQESKKTLEAYSSILKAKMVDPEDVEFSIPLSNVERICPVAIEQKRKGETKVCFSFDIIFRQDHKTDFKIVKFHCMETGNIDLTARWIAVLSLRCGLYDKEMLKCASRVVIRGVTLLQARARSILYRVDISQFRETSGLRTIVSSIFPPDKPFLERESSKSSTGTRGSVGDPSYPDGMQTPMLGQTQKGMSSRLFANPLAPDEEEDEIWENERWNFLGVKSKNLIRGWSSSNNLPQERDAFSDRIGNSIGKSSFDINKTPVPEGWQVTKPFCVDKSLIMHAQCDEDGWRYESQFNALDSKQAKGQQRGKISGRWVVRHRRWFRRRAPMKPLPQDVVLKRTPDWIICSGWLGMRGVSTGIFWKSRYCFVCIPLKGNKSLPARIKEPLWGYFRGDFPNHRGGMGLVEIDWDSLGEKAAKFKILCRGCGIDTSVLPNDLPGYFRLRLMGESKPRLFNAGDKVERIRWITALKQAITVADTVSIDSPSVHRLPVSDSSSSPEDVDSHVSLDSHTSSVDDIPLSPASKSTIVGSAVSSRTSSPTNDGEKESNSEFDNDNEEVEFVHPEPYENTIVNEVISVSVDTAKHLLFIDPAFDDLMYKIDGYSKIDRGEWSAKDRVGSKRSVTYLMPRNGPVPQNTAFLSFEFAQSCKGKGYQIKVTVSNPEVPYGRCFETQLCYLLSRETEETCRVLVWHQVHFLQSTMMKGFIRSGGTREVTNSFRKVWFPQLVKYLASSKGNSDSGNVPIKAPFTPEPYDHFVTEAEVSLNVDRLCKMLFLDSAFLSNIFAQDRGTNFEITEWDKGIEQGSKKDISYSMPKSGPMPFYTVSQRLYVEQSVPGTGYVVDQEISTPEVPFGKTFQTRIRVILESMSPTTSKMSVSNTFYFSQNTFMKPIIKAGGHREVNSLFKKKWLPTIFSMVEKQLSEIEEDGNMKKSIQASENSVSTPQINKVTNSTSTLYFGIAVVLVLLFLFAGIWVQMRELASQQQILLKIIAKDV